LARRELGKGEAESIAEATIRLNPEAHFFQVSAAGVQVGYASVTVDTTATGFRLSQVMALDVPQADSTRRVTRRTDLILSRSLRLRSFTRTISGAGLFEEFTGTVEGDTVVRMAERDQREGLAEEWLVRIPGEVVLPEVLPYRLAFGKRLEVGRMVSANVLDLATGRISRVGFSATAESTFVVADSAVEQRALRRWRPVAYDTVKAWRIEHTASGTPEVNWVDGTGGLVSTEAALGVRLERSAFELVSFNYRQALVQRGAEPHRAIPGMTTLVEAGIVPTRATSAAYRVNSEPIERFLLPRVAWLAGGRQAARDEEVRIGIASRERPDSTKSDFLDPALGARPVSAEVTELARTAAGEGTDPEATVRRLVAWIAKSITLDPTPTAPLLPRRVLQERRAGAEGMSALLVDLTRAAGLTARPVAGAASIGGRIYGHAWVEVLVDGAWLAVDPSFGQVPASPSLIRLTIGGGGRAIDVVPLLGSATIAPTDTVTER
jgi:transglutaminase-like putative cysteine protease